MSEKVCCATCKYASGVKCLNPTGHCDLTVDGYPKWEPKARDHDTKTLLDEFAKAAMEAIISKTPHGTYEYHEVNELNSQYNMTAGGAYSYAAAMMKERKLYNDDGTLKEEVTEQ